MMKINSIPAEHITTFALNTELKPQLYLNKTVCDSVSFSGHKRANADNNLTQRQQSAIQISKKLTKLAHSNSLTKENIESVLNQNSPVPIEIYDIKDAPDYIKQVMGGELVAHMLPGYDASNLQLAQATIYINLDKQTTNKETNSLIADIAHEYTHVLQRAEDKNYYSLTNYNLDISKITQIAQESQIIMQNYLGNCGNALFSNSQRTKTILHSRLQNPNSLKPLIPKEDLNGSISAKANVLKQSFGQDELPVGTWMKQFILQEAQNEVEAYEVTEQVLKNSGKYDEMTLAKLLLSKDLHESIVDLLK